LLCIELAHPGELWDGTLLEVTLVRHHACMLPHMHDTYRDAYWAACMRAGRCMGG
jgi:hypothetical protein